MASSGATLEDIPSVDIMTELLRRFKCNSKADKRLVLVGVCAHLIFLFLVEYLFHANVYVSFLIFVCDGVFVLVSLLELWLNSLFPDGLSFWQNW